MHLNCDMHAYIHIGIYVHLAPKYIHTNIQYVHTYIHHIYLTSDENELPLRGHDPRLAIHLPDDNQLALIFDLFDNFRAIRQTLHIHTR